MEEAVGAPMMPPGFHDVGPAVPPDDDSLPPPPPADEDVGDAAAGGAALKGMKKKFKALQQEKRQLTRDLKKAQQKQQGLE